MENNLTYKTSGEFQVPDLSLRENPQSQPLGKYGRMRQAYLREHRPILWNQMILSETLFSHLREIDEAANRRLEQMMPELMTSAGVTEALKAADPLKWTGADEHLQSASRGSDPRGADLRITEPVQGEQISFMPEAENVQTFSASPVLDYNSIKEMHPDDIVLYQVGDFFEICGEDAKQAASLLDMNLTTRQYSRCWARGNVRPSVAHF